MIQNKYKILVVEDDANIRNIVSTILETSGYQVLLAESCMLAKTLFSSCLPDLIILDLGRKYTGGKYQKAAGQHGTYSQEIGCPTGRDQLYYQ